MTGRSPDIALWRSHALLALALEPHCGPARKLETAMHALIIENEAMVAAAIEYVLRDCGFDSIAVADSSQAAIAAAASQCPDLIVADVLLKSGCGIQAVENICGHPRIPVVFITGADLDVRDRLSGYTVLRKPFSEETLTYAVAASLSQGSLPAALTESRKDGSPGLIRTGDHSINSR
jgi:DNA-binding response OmpR family regulator